MQRQSHKAVLVCSEPNSKQHMLESCSRAERDIVLFLLSLLFVCVCCWSPVLYARPMPLQKKVRKWAITVKVTSVPWGWPQDPCPQLVKQLVCVCVWCSSGLPWLNPFPLYAWKRPVSKMNLLKDWDPHYILVSLVTAWFILYLSRALIKRRTPGWCQLWGLDNTLTSAASMQISLLCWDWIATRCLKESS